MLYPNPKNQHPKISETAWISENAVIVGDVTIGENVYVAHNVIIRADEPGSSIVIGDNCNVQDAVIIHGLGGSKVDVKNNTSLAHGCIIHGPCTIGERCFVGFGAVVFDCNIGEDVVILHNSTVRAVDIPSCKVVNDGQIITEQKLVEDLDDICHDLEKFKASVIDANLELVEGYCKLAQDSECK
ncbi:carbonate dehydratase [Methanolobus bombayensis]|uniref:carbonate dehydratase n=1 Tax=Methanolobus bombayensis TaxID=38023 RepID=UPI001AEB69D1|nr:carbonate dehydratase [Methanolobus bombayensis]MBP1908516.1 carbonic anhydrase/acetyltransferase-like protein (isoleucine patch superfamily) [Methanolobus bombayensis]